MHMSIKLNSDMNKEKPKQDLLSSPKEDFDSGLDYTSDSGHSNNDDISSTSSDYDDSFNSDNEKTLSEKKKNSSRKNEVTSSSESCSENDFCLSTGNNLKQDACSMNIARDSVTFSEKENNFEKNDDFRIELCNLQPLEKEYEEAINFFKKLINSQCETVDFSINSQSKKPDWLDEEKFKKGQKFAREHLFCLNFAEMVSLFILFAQKSSLEPLIFTGKSDSPFTAFNRYLNTLTKLISWYTDDLWNDDECTGKRNLCVVRSMHKNVYHNLTNSSPIELSEKTQLGDPRTTALWCPLQEILVKDFTESLAPPFVDLLQIESCKKEWINQADMSLTQFGFVGLAVTFPKAFGIHLATDEDLDAFLHLWRGLGYSLGIKDEYNYCCGDLETVRKRTKFFLEKIAKPSFRDVTCDWEHMCRCLTAGISYYIPHVNFESALLYLCDILQINTPRLRKQMSFYHYIIYLMHKLVFYLMKFRSLLPWFNSRLYVFINKAQTAPPEVVTMWENKEFTYMKQPGKCPIREQLIVTKL